MVDFLQDLPSDKIGKFLQDNHGGTLAFAGDRPYAIPMAYMYKKGTVLIGLVTPGRKMDYLAKSRNVCLTISKTVGQPPNPDERCTTVILEGTLEEVTDRSNFDLPPENREIYDKFGLKLFWLKADTVSGKKCILADCGYFKQKKSK